MPKTKRNPVFLVFGAIAALLVLGVISNQFEKNDHRAGAEEQAAPTPTGGKASEEALAKIIADKKIVNVHEHIQDIRQAKIMLDAMDKHGMQKTLLMGSSWFTITLRESVGFTRYDENNEELLKIVKAYPGRFEAYPTIDPLDPDHLPKIKSLVERGARGVKLYLGHGYTRRDTRTYMFHTMALDDERMMPFYQYCEDNYIPLCFHVQPFAPGFAQELIVVLTRFPDMKVNCPHFLLSTILDSRLREFLETFPNLYSDVSFGHDDFLIAGLKRISSSPEKFRKLFADYPDRFLFGTDLVMTEIDSKTAEWFSERAQAYYDLLSKSTYTTPFIPGTQLNGLQLPPDVLEKVLYKNYERFETSKPEGTKITREIDWSKMGQVQKLDREPGQAFPPPPPRKRR